MNKLIETSTSRIYKHLSDENSCAIISSYRSENTEEENLKLFSSLKSDVRALKLGYIEFISRWVEDGESSDEKSILIPGVSFHDAYMLGQKYKQSSIIFKDSDSCQEYCTTPFENYKPGDVVRTYNNVGPNMLNLNDAKDIFERRKAGPASKPRGGKAFNLQVIEKFPAKPSTFRGSKEYIVYESF